MESKVKLSGYAWCVTWIVNLALLAGCLALFNEKPGFWILLCFLALLLIFGLLYGPIRIVSTPDFVTVKSGLLSQKIPMCDIENVQLFQPTMGAYRLFASGGYFGYWGVFREGDIGRYVAYYGKASDCFLIRMKNGGNYVLGCENPSEMVSYIRSHLTR